MIDREQIRRELGVYNDANRASKPLSLLATESLLRLAYRLLAELEQAERECDEAIHNQGMWMERAEAAEAKLAKVPALVEALRESIDFAAEGWAYAAEYFRTKWHYEDAIKGLRAALSAWENE